MEDIEERERERELKSLARFRHVRFQDSIRASHFAAGSCKVVVEAAALMCF